MIIFADQELAKEAVLEFDGGSRVEFQYPPKLISDGRKGTWDEKDSGGTEPVAVYKASGPRTWTLQITYINDGSAAWAFEKIKSQVTLIRGYFQRIKDGSQALNQRNLVVKLKLWQFGGNDLLTFRMKSCDVKYSDTLIMRGGQPNTAWPLLTTITLDLAAWIQDGFQELEILTKTMPTDWY